MRLLTGLVRISTKVIDIKNYMYLEPRFILNLTLFSYPGIWYGQLYKFFLTSSPEEVIIL